MRPRESSRRQGHDKTAASALRNFAARIAAVAARDLPYQCQAQSGSGGLAGDLRAMERPEDVLKFGRLYTWTAVPDGDDRGVGSVRDFHMGGGCAMTARILEQIAQQASQQPRIATDADDGT